jgi:purine-nucleoside phosphorylase
MEPRRRAGILPAVMTLYDQVQETVRVIRERAPGREPAVGIILGSGLGGFAQRFTDVVTLPYVDLPHFPHSSVPGHASRLVLGRIRGVPVVAMQGRVHAYEGYSPAEVAFPARVLCALGIRALVVTNASGGINLDFMPGDLMVITDHLNLSGFNPLTGPNDERFGPRFPDLSMAYHHGLRELLAEVSQRTGIPLKSGVYAQVSGPTYETPAEIRMLRKLGADAVGMSTVPEVIAARHMGVPVAGISCVTNLAAGIGHKPITHEEVAQTAAQVADTFSRLLSEFLPAAATAPL